MRIFFIGTVEFSMRALEKLIQLRADIVGVATKASSTFNSDFASLADTCRRSGIRYREVSKINDEPVVAWIRELEPDYIFCFGWSELLKKEILEIPSKGTIGFHPAELPANRGRHPIVWALFLGLPRTASTFFFMDEGADSGDIVSQRIVAIDEADDASSLYEKVTRTALEQIEEFLPQLESGNFQRVRQLPGSGNNWRKRGKSDGLIDWRMSCSAIYNLVRALTIPFAGAHLVHKSEEIKVWKVEIAKEYALLQNVEPGKITNVDIGSGTVDVKAYDGVIRILKHGFLELPQAGEYLL